MALKSFMVHIPYFDSFKIWYMAPILGFIWSLRHLFTGLSENQVQSYAYVQAWGPYKWSSEYFNYIVSALIVSLLIVSFQALPTSPADFAQTLILHGWSVIFTGTLLQIAIPLWLGRLLSSEPQTQRKE